MRLHFSIGCYDCRRTARCVTVSNSAEFKSFLLITCIDAPESTTNSLSFALVLDGEGRHHFSVGEKTAVFFFSINFEDFLCQIPRCSASPMLLSLCLFLRPILKFWSVRGSLVRITMEIFIERQVSVSKFGRAQCGFGQSNTSVRFLHG